MEGLGINWKILVGQIINFAILFFLLKKFVFKAFLNTLERRKKTIEEGVKKSVEAAGVLTKARIIEKEVKKASEKNAKEIIKAAESNAEKKRQEILALAEKEKQKIILGAKEKAERELREDKEKQKRETVEMSFLLAEKFLKEKFDQEKDKKFLEDLLASLK